MADQNDLLLEFHKIQLARAEHYERERSSMSTLVLAIASGLIGLVTFDERIMGTDALLGFLVAGCGVLGFVVSRLHHFRALRHGRRASAYRDAIGQTVPLVNTIKEAVDKQHAEQGYKSDLRLHHTWSVLHCGIIVVGMTVILLAW